MVIDPEQIAVLEFEKVSAGRMVPFTNKRVFDMQQSVHTKLH